MANPKQEITATEQSAQDRRCPTVELGDELTEEVKVEDGDDVAVVVLDVLGVEVTVLVAVDVTENVAVVVAEVVTLVTWQLLNSSPAW